MSEKQLEQKLSTVGISKENAMSVLLGESSVPSSLTPPINFVVEGSLVNGGLTINATNGVDISAGSFVWAAITNAGQPAQYQWGLSFNYELQPGWLWYPLELERKEKYTEIAGLVNYRVFVYTPGVGIRQCSLDKTLKKYETGQASPHYIFDGYDAGRNQFVLIGDFPGGLPSVVVKDKDAYNTFYIHPLAIQNYNTAIVIDLNQDPNVRSLSPGDYEFSVMTSTTVGDSFTMRVGARNVFASVPTTSSTTPSTKQTKNKVSTAVVPNNFQARPIIILPSMSAKEKDENEVKKDEPTISPVPARPNQ